MENQACPVIAIELDKERHLRFDLNAYAAFEKETGVEMFDLEGKFSATVIRALLWASLLHEEKTLTLEQVGAMVHAGNMVYVQQQINKAYELAVAESAKGTASKN